jgi:hypothetical protein
LPGREIKATHCRNPRAGTDEAGPPGASWLRVRAQWHRQSLHAVRPARGLAPRQGHRPPYGSRLRSRPKDLDDTHFASAKTTVLVQDNLNIHCKASLYEAFPAAEARRLVERFEWHYTPKHGSWLDLAESELGVLSSQCLDRRIPEKQTLIEEIAAWENDRNARHTNWHFTTPDARIKLKTPVPFNLIESGD